MREICRGLGARFSPTRGEHYEELSPDTVIALLASPDTALFGPEPAAARDAFLSDTALAARRQLEDRLGADPANWTWGALHVIHFRHALAHLPGAGGAFELGPLPRPGDGYTVNATSFDASWEQVAGASYREILNLEDWDQSMAINTPGQSGRPGTPHYADLTPLWDAGRYFPMAYSRQAVERATIDRESLQP
jgi:penicillin amidase